MKQPNHIIIFLVIFIQIAFVLSCTTKKATRDKILQNYANVIPRIGSSIKEIKSKLGTPVKQEISKVPNLHIQGQVDLLYTLFYDGLEIKVLQLSHTQKELVVSVSVMSDKWDRNFKFQTLGKTCNYIKKLLGEPHYFESNYWIYQIDEFGSQVKFEFEKNRVKKVSILPHID